MKRFLIMAVAVAGLCACSQNKYVIDGNIAGLDEMVYLFDETGAPVDSVMAKKGEFRIKGLAEAPSVGYLGTNENSEHQLGVMLFIEPGTIIVEGSIESPMEITTTGTPANDANNAFTQQSKELAAQFRAPETTPERRVELDNEFSQLSRKAMEANMTNLFGAVVLAQQLAYELRASETLEAVAKFPEALQQTAMLQQVKEMAEKKLKTEAGQPYIDIVQNNAEGQPVSLKSVVENPANKYVLVDFWASWCMPCMAEVPYLLKDYAEYQKKGFEIYGVSFDTEMERWTGTIKERGMNWVQVSDLKRFDNQAARDYAVNSIPANYLIDCATGKIVAVNLRGEALGQMLANLLQ